MASADKKQTIKHLPNGPYLCSNLSVLVSYADGTHKTNGFTGDKDTGWRTRQTGKLRR